jgi:hypothetical protein
MKANEAPEKILIAVYGNDLSYEWHSDSEFEAKDHNDIEYTRTDAFLIKACETFCKIRCNDKPPRSTCTSLGTCFEHDEFRKTLKYSLENLI